MNPAWKILSIIGGIIGSIIAIFLIGTIAIAILIVFGIVYIIHKLENWIRPIRTSKRDKPNKDHGIKKAEIIKVE